MLLGFTKVKDQRGMDFILAELERIQKNCGKDAVRVARKGLKDRGQYAIFIGSS